MTSVLPPVRAPRACSGCCPPGVWRRGLPVPSTQAQHQQRGQPETLPSGKAQLLLHRTSDHIAFVLSENKSLLWALDKHSEGKEGLEPRDFVCSYNSVTKLAELPERGRVGLGSWAGLWVWGPDFCSLVGWHSSSLRDVEPALSPPLRRGGARRMVRVVPL